MNNLGTLLYIDPGTGAMLFSVLMGVVGALFYAVQKAVIKIKFMFAGGNVKEKSEQSIPYVIFSDSKRYWNIFKPICDEFEKRKIKCEYWTASPDDPALDENYEYVHCQFIGEGNKAYAKLNLMRADVCLATTPGLDVYQWKRSKNVKFYAHIVHEIGEPTMYRMFGTDYFDAVLLNGDFQKADIRKLEELRGLPEKELEIVGSGYMDAMQAKFETLGKTEKHTKEERVVLAAPTWGASSILNRYGETFIQALVDTGYKIIIRPHPQTAIADPKLLEKLMKKFPDNDKFEWNSDNDNFNVLNEADVMISDFSGVVFDYALIFDKPIIYTDTKLDLAPYDASWLDEENWRKQVMPKLGVELKEEQFPVIKDIIDSLIEEEKYQAGREYVREVAWKHKGRAAVNTVDYLVNKYEELVGENEG